jgi:hypothetical protein
MSIYSLPIASWACGGTTVPAVTDTPEPEAASDHAHQGAWSNDCSQCKDAWLQDREESYRTSGSSPREANTLAARDWAEMLGEAAEHRELEAEWAASDEAAERAYWRGQGWTEAEAAAQAENDQWDRQLYGD